MFTRSSRAIVEKQGDLMSSIIPHNLYELTLDGALQRVPAAEVGLLLLMKPVDNDIMYYPAIEM